MRNAYNFRAIKQNAPPANGTRKLPKNAKNAITMKNIHAGEPMINFFNESASGRYYTYESFKKLKPKIKVSNLTRYRARGGRSQKLRHHK